MFTKGDFHLHTNVSDGKLTPSELVKLAKHNGLDIISINDHDTLNGIAEAISTGIAEGIKVIPAFELSTIKNGENIHVLAYFKDDSYKDKAFIAKLKEITDYRITRAKKIVENLEKYFNININHEDVLNNADGIVARPHIAKTILQAGYDYEWEELFKTVLSQDSPAYVPNKLLSVEEGIDLLRSTNCLIVLAHPVLIKKSEVKDILTLGFDGIEAIYFQNSPSDTEKYISLAKEFNILITAGSDFHGLSKEDESHAHTPGETFLCGEALNNFVEALSK